MQSDDQTDPLVEEFYDALADAERVRQDLANTRDQLTAASGDLQDLVSDLSAAGVIDGPEAKRIHEFVQRAEFEQARHVLLEAVSDEVASA